VGSPIPILVTLRSQDEVALDLLSTPSSINVFLTRSIAIGSEATNDDAPRRSNNTFLENVGKAFFWPAAEGAPEADVKRLHGEIDIRKSLKPSFVFPRFTLRVSPSRTSFQESVQIRYRTLCLQYYITLAPFTATGFASSTTDAPSLLTEKVSIVTENAPGVVPRSHAPPGYVRPEEGDYNNSVGYLENGNQRFYHHHPGF
jgi:hypothetical protein